MTTQNTTPLPTIVLTPAKAAVSERGGSMDVLIRIQAPDQPEDQALRYIPKRLSLVIDRSGSMHGEPLTEALRCASHIASRMTAADELSVVVYDSHVETLVPLAPVTSTQSITDRLAGVQSGGNTALFDGWESGAQSLEGGKGDAISRVILLSDGQANVGLTQASEIAPDCAKWLAKGVSTTTVGLGRGFNEDLMMEMARSGGGQNYYGQTAADLYDSFDEEFSLLAALYLKNLGLRLVPADGVILEPMGIFSVRADEFYKLSDLAYGSEAWMVMRLHINASPVQDLRDLFALVFKADTLDGQGLLPMMEMLSLPVVAHSAFEALPVDSLVERRTMELEFAKESQALRDLAREGDMRAVRELLDRLQAKFGGHPWLHDKLARLRDLAEHDAEMMGKESQFSARRMSSRLSMRDEILYSRDETGSEMPAFLRKKAEAGKGRSR